MKLRISVSVIMISAYESIDLVERCILSGADYLDSPKGLGLKTARRAAAAAAAADADAAAAAPGPDRPPSRADAHRVVRACSLCG